MRGTRLILCLVGLLLLAGCTTRGEKLEPTVVVEPTRAPTATPSTTVTMTPPATATLEPTATPHPTPTEAPEMVEFTILYDNNPDVEGLRTGWGFACLVELPEGTLLFDTGGDGAALLANFEALGKDPRAVDVVVLSHAHGDHTGGLAALLESGAAPTVYVPAGLAGASSRRVEVDEPQELLPGVWTTGAVRGSVTEQALVVQSVEGWVLVTGCAHPGIVRMTRRAQEAVGEEIHLVMGGFHLQGESAVRVEGLIEELRTLGVEEAAPTHCSGAVSRRLFKEAFGEQGYLIGVGSTFRLER